MTPSQRRLLRQTFESMVPLPRQFGLLFYQRLFETAPQLRPLFHGNAERQATMLVNSLTLAVLNIVDEERASNAIRDLGARHREYGVRDDQYDSFGAALEWTFSQRLGDGFTPELRAAWNEAWHEIARTMKAAADEGA
jgi:hemoglobin-like flavoprotein